MKKTIALCCLWAVLFIQNINSQELGALHTDRNGGFTISMPFGWQAENVGLRFMSLRRPNSFIPNIAFVNEDFSGPVSAYIDRTMNTFVTSPLFSGFRLINRSSFRTNAGLVGESITYLLTKGNVQVRQKMYVFPNRRGTAVIEITGTAPAAGGERYDAIFDASVRTFNWTR